MDLVRVIGNVEVAGWVAWRGDVPRVKEKSGDFLCQYMLGWGSIHGAMRRGSEWSEGREGVPEGIPFQNKVSETAEMGQ